MNKTLPPLPDLNRLAPFVGGLGKAILRELIEDLAAIEADRVSRDVPAGLVDVLQEAALILFAVGDKPNSAPTNFRYPIADELEGFAAMLAAAPQPQPVQASDPIPGVFVAGLGHQTGCNSHKSANAFCNCGYTGSAFVKVLQPAEQAKEE